MGRPRIVDIASSARLKKLKLHSVPFTDQEFNNFVSKLSLLEDLSVRSCDLLESIAISCNYLRNLNFYFCKSLRAIDADTPNLLSFSYENNPIPNISMNAPCPWVVSVDSEGSLDNHWFLKVKEFLSASNQIEKVFLTMKSDETSFNLDEFREFYPSLPFEVGNLDLLMEVPPSDYEILLDGLFWICYPRTLTVYSGDEQRCKFLQWLYDQLQNRDAKCCNSRDIKCWRHYLKGTKIGSFQQYSDCRLVNFEIDTLMDGWPMIPEGTLHIDFDWCFPVIADK